MSGGFFPTSTTTEAPVSLHAWIDTLSMHRYTKDMKAHLLIGHSRSDNKVHFTESLTLSQNLPNAPEPTVVIVGVFSHVDLALNWNSVETIWRETLPGMRQVWTLAYHVLHKQR